MGEGVDPPYMIEKIFKLYLHVQCLLFLFCEVVSVRPITVDEGGRGPGRQEAPLRPRDGQGGRHPRGLWQPAVGVVVVAGAVGVAPVLGRVVILPVLQQTYH